MHVFKVQRVVCLFSVSFSFSDCLSVQSVQLFNHVRLIATPWTAACQASLSITNSWSLLKFMSIESVMPSNLSSSVVPFSSCLQSSTASGSMPMSWLFTLGGQSPEASAWASVLPMNNQCWIREGLTDFISVLSRDSQESSPAPQFESISSSMLSLLCGPTLTIVHDCWKNHSFDYIDLC